MAPCLAASLRGCLEEVSDPRSAHACRHPLTSVLFLALTAVIGGADTWVEVEEFGQDHRAWFERWLCLPHGIPSHDTFGRVFALLDPEQPGWGLPGGCRACTACSPVRRRSWTARPPGARTTGVTVGRPCTRSAPTPVRAGWCWPCWTWRVPPSPWMPSVARRNWLGTSGRNRPTMC
ncbi:MAG: transposase family protein [Caldilineaceae bacterium SB0662_bin_9]|uniref:Transposase family protein n=1 Tax=Caldilineaceae bacterium SB0662_bin_9 TaxID=2605258 RepID=A0A6B1DVR5_9CHLR|nr:transposase family protein [Caldilineaceae bacterium SB0662_bin_9]